MDIGAIFLSLTVLVLVGMFVSAPFLQQQREPVVESQDVSGLMAEHERILNALQELDFDNILGKIPAEDYPTMRKALLQQGVEILHKLDEVHPAASAVSAEDQIEAAIAARRADSTVTINQEEASRDEDLEALIAKHRTTRQDKSAGFCPKCGNPILVSDVFCPRCGNALK